MGEYTIIGLTEIGLRMFSDNTQLCSAVVPSSSQTQQQPGGEAEQWPGCAVPPPAGDRHKWPRSPPILQVTLISSTVSRDIYVKSHPLPISSCMVTQGVDFDWFWRGLPSQNQSPRVDFNWFWRGLQNQNQSKSTPRVTMMLLIHKECEICYLPLNNMFYLN